MSHTMHNTMIDIYKSLEKMQIDIIESICTELSCEDRVSEFTEKYVDTSFKKMKTVKDKNMPKRAVSGYILYCKQARDKVVQGTPDMKLGEVSKILGAQWKNLKVSEKKKFIVQAEEDKERYEKELAEYKLKTN